MAVVSKEELFTQIHGVLSKLDTDESVTFLENMTDTYNEMERRANGDGEDWKRKYEENDSAWRKRYSDRFLKNPTINNYGFDEDETEKEITEEQKAETITVDDLFK